MATRPASVILALCLVLVSSSCSGGVEAGDGSVSSTAGPSSTTGTGTPGTSEITLWIPSSLGLAEFFRTEIGQDLEATKGRTLAIIEPDLPYSEIEAAVADGVASGDLAGTVILVPEVIGYRLIDAGVLEDTDRTLFSIDDPDRWVFTLGVLMAIPASPNAGEAAAQTADMSVDALFRPGSAVAAQGDPVAEGLGWDATEVHDVAVDTTVALAKNLAEDLRDEALGDLGEIAGAELAAVGYKVMGKVLCAAGVILGVADFVFTMWEFQEGVSGAFEAHAGAATAATETAYKAAGAMSNLTTDLYELRAAMVTGEICSEASAERIEQIKQRSAMLQNVARDAMSEMAAEGRDTSHVEQLIDNHSSRISDLAAQLEDELGAHTCSDTSGTYLVVPPGTAGIHFATGPIIDPSLAAFATLLTGIDIGNTVRRSDGQATAVSSGFTDLTYLGNGWVDFPPALFDAGGMQDVGGSCGQLPSFWAQHAGLTAVCGPHGFVPPEGPTAVFGTAFAGEIPPAGSTYSLQYGVVLQYNDPAANYQPSASYPDDFFADTGLWLELTYRPDHRWVLSVVDGIDFAALPSDAFALIIDNTITWVVSDHEVQGTQSYRASAYRHTGDWGMSGGPWNGDVYPVVGDPLMPIDQTMLRSRSEPVVGPFNQRQILAHDIGAALEPAVTGFGGPDVPTSIWSGVGSYPECWAADAALGGLTPHAADSFGTFGGDRWSSTTVRVFESEAEAEDYLALQVGQESRDCFGSLFGEALTGDGAVIDSSTGFMVVGEESDQGVAVRGEFEITVPEDGPATLVIDESFLRVGNAVIESTFVVWGGPPTDTEALMEALGEVAAEFSARLVFGV